MTKIGGNIMMIPQKVGVKKHAVKKVVKRERQENVPEGDYLKVNQPFQLILNLEILIISRMYKEKKMFLLFLK